MVAAAKLAAKKEKEAKAKCHEAVYNKLMNTPSMIVSPSIILFQPHVGRFHASDWAKILISCRLSGNVWPTSGGMASCSQGMFMYKIIHYFSLQTHKFSRECSRFTHTHK